MPADIDYIFTGYNNLRHSQVNSVNSPTFEDGSGLTALLDQYIDNTQFTYQAPEKLDGPSLIPHEEGLSGLQESKLLSQLPWITPWVFFFQALEPVKVLIRSMGNNFFKSTTATDENSQAYLKILQGENPQSSTNSQSHIGSRLLTLRFLDIVQSLDKKDIAIDDDEQLVWKNTLLPKKIDLFNWTKIVSDASSVLRAEKSKDQSHSNTGKMPPNLTEDQRIGRGLYLFADTNERTRLAAGIYANVALACLAIRRLLQGRLDNPRGKEDITQEFGEGLPDPSEGISSLARPLELAISISPLVLFTQKKLSSIHIARSILATHWIQQGNIRHPEVWKMEKKIWKGLIDIANNNGPIEEKIENILTSISGIDMDERTKTWFNVEKSQNLLPEEFLSFLHRMAIGKADISANPAEVQPFLNPPSSSTSVIPDIFTALAAFQKSNSWQSLGVEPSLFNRQKFLPRTPPLTPTPPFAIPDPRPMVIDNTDLLQFWEPPHPGPELSSENTSPINPQSMSIDNTDVPEPPLPTNASYPMDIDDTDLPPAYQADSLESMEVCGEESLLPSVPHPTPIRNNLLLPTTLPPRREISPMVPDDCYQMAFSEERNREQGAKSLAETFNHAANANASGSKAIARRKFKKSDITPKTKKARLEAIQLKDKKQIIDLSLEEIPQPLHQLGQVKANKNYSSQEMLYLPDGEHRSYTTSFHTEYQLQRFQSLQARVQKGFEDGNSSILNILTNQSWSGMSSTDVQEKLKKGPVLIKNGGPSSMGFDGKLFADMLGHGDMRRVVQMEDQSENGGVIPSAMESLLISHREGDGGKSLLADSFPVDSPHLERAVSSTRIALQATRGDPLCKDIFTHQGWASWGGAATKGSFINFPMDPDGLCLHLRVRTGEIYVLLEDNETGERRCEGVVAGPNARLLFSPRFSVTMLAMTSAAWEAEVFYCRGSIMDTCRAMFRCFLRGDCSKRRGDAWRIFCRYVRYLKKSFMDRQETEGCPLTEMEQGHVPSLNTMDGLADLFALLVITLLLDVIDYRRYPESSPPASVREEEEIILAQSEALTLVEFLKDKMDLVDEGTGEDVSAETAFFAYIVLQGRWLLWQLDRSPVRQNEVRGQLASAEFFRRKEQLKGDLGKEWGGEAPDCFTPLNEALKIKFRVFSIRKT